MNANNCRLKLERETYKQVSLKNRLIILKQSRMRVTITWTLNNQVKILQWEQKIHQKVKKNQLDSKNQSQR